MGSRGRVKAMRNYALPSEEPKKLSLSRKEVLLWTGITSGVFDYLSSSGRIPYKILKKGGARYYRNEDVERILLRPDVNPVR
jgi:hypothetical protein